MSTLTKICIVMMVVLAIPTSAVMIQSVLTRANYKQAYEGQLLAARDARHSAGAAQAMLSKLNEDYKALRQIVDQSGNSLAYADFKNGFLSLHGMATSALSLLPISSRRCGSRRRAPCWSAPRSIPPRRPLERS